MPLSEKLQRVEIAGEILKNASITKTKKAAQKLGDETLSLLSAVVSEVNECKKEITLLKQKVTHIEQATTYQRIG